MNEAKELEKAGCFALVLELMPDKRSLRKITKAVKIPTIGIGAGRKVTARFWSRTILGLRHLPSFAKPRVDLKQIIVKRGQEL